MLNIKKTRTTPYHPQCDGQVERMNRTIIALLNLNVRDATNDLNFNIGLMLMAYRSAVQALTDYTPYCILYGRKMRLPIDVIYRPPKRDQSRTDYAIEMRKTLDQVYEVARDHLQLAHKRQQDYYDRSTRGKRFKQRESVWLHTPVLKKGLAPKFHEPWTRPFKVKKQLSDVTYGIHNMANKTSKVMDFNSLKRATVKCRVHKLSVNELEPSSNKAKEEELSDYTPIHRQPAKPVKEKFPEAKPQPQREKQNARAVTPRKAEPTQYAPDALATPNVEMTPVAKQATSKVEAAPIVKHATPAKQEEPKPGPTLALAPFVALKVDKAKRVKPKPAARLMALDHPPRSSKRSYKGVPPPRLGFQSAILIIAL